MRRVGVLTGGGDVPGLNAAIQAIALGLGAQNIEVVGIRRGWLGLLAVQPGDAASVREHTVALSREVVADIAHLGGTILRSSRTNPKRAGEASADAKRDATSDVLAHLEGLELDALCAIGGDDTLGYARHLSAAGVPIVGLPKTMDNDVGGTEICLGFASAVDKATKLIGELKTVARSHERLLVIEVMGRNSGASCLWPAVLAGADRALIAEVPVDLDRLGELLLQDRSSRSERFAVALISEGAKLLGGEVLESGRADMYGHRKLGGIGAVVAAGLRDRTGTEVMEQRLGYLVRAGAPSMHDVLLAQGFSRLALELLNSGTFGRMVAIEQGRYTHVPLAAATCAGPTSVLRLYDEQQMRPRMGADLNRGLWPID